METQHYAGQPSKRNPNEQRRAANKDATHQEAHAKEVRAKAEQAALSVMHPESFDPEWRYYHGAWGG